MSYCTPKEICTNSLQTFRTKVGLSIPNYLVLGFLGGAYVAFGAGAATMVSHDIPLVGAARLAAGAIFSTGLMLVLIAGAELFTGNVMIWMGVMDGKVKLSQMARNWFWVYSANFIGSVAVAYLMFWSGLWTYNNSLVGAYVLKTAVGKMTLAFPVAIVRGILCNWLVCLAVWMAYAAKDIVGKIFGIFFPITLFVISNFEHSIANMYFIPAAILARGNAAAVEASHLGDKVGVLTWGNFLTSNLLPVTIGNILGAAFFVACFYWFAYLRGAESTAAAGTATADSKATAALYLKQTSVFDSCPVAKSCPAMQPAEPLQQLANAVNRSEVGVA